MNTYNLYAKFIKKSYGTFFCFNNLSFVIIFLSGSILLPIQNAMSKEIYLKCTGKFEINRGQLIRPDWETSYLIINLNGLKSIIEDKGIKKYGETFISGSSYTVTHRDQKNKIKTKYKINGRYGNYVVDYPQKDRTLIGNCQKGRG